MTDCSAPTKKKAPEGAFFFGFNRALQGRDSVPNLDGNVPLVNQPR